MIFILEDEASIRELMVFALESVGFEVKGFSTSAAFNEALSETTPQLILLDIMLPDGDGVAILNSIRADRDLAAVPVIMTTAKGTETDKVLGLNAGADDYMVKPFGMMEMIARVKAVMRRCAPKDKRSAILVVGELNLNNEDHQVMVGTEKVQLTVKEFDMLRCFMENEGRAFTREELLSIVWGVECSGETRTVDVHIGTLRTKLGRCGAYIQTVRGVGYRLEFS